MSEAASRAPSAPGVSLQGGDDAPRVRARRSGIRFGWGFAGAGVCAASYALAPGIEGLFGAALGLLMLGVASSDARRFIVPDVLSGGAFALGMIHAVATSHDSASAAALTALARAALAGGLLWLVRVGYRRFRGRDGLGLGDVKLAAAAGAWLSVQALPMAIEIAALAALAAYAFRQKKRARVLRGAARVPFGAFFAPAIWLGWALDSLFPYLG